MGLSYGLVNLMYSMLYSEHWRIKGSRSNKRRKLLTCFTLSCRETGPEVYNTNISMDIKHMPPSKSPYKYILVLLCDISNFLVATPMKKATPEEVCSILFDNFMAYYAVPMRIICDQDPAFMSSLCQWFFKAYGIQLVTVSPTNHKSLQAEHGIKSLSNILIVA